MAEQKPLKEQLDNGVKMPVTTIILTFIAMYLCQTKQIETMLQKREICIVM